MTIRFVWHMMPCTFVHETARLIGVGWGWGGATDGRVQRVEKLAAKLIFQETFFNFLPPEFLNYSSK